MILKEAKSPRCRQAKQIPTKEVSEYAKLFRPVAPSLAIPRRLAKKDSKAKLNKPAEPLKPTPREFSSYFLSTQVHSDPSYPVTSHTDSEPTQPPSTTNPCPVQSLRWNPYVTTTTIPKYQERNVLNSETVELRDNSNHNSSRYVTTSSTSPSRSARLLRNNIMTFRDQQTMTIKVYNACVGNTPRSSEHSIASADIAVRNRGNHSPILSFPMPEAYSTKEYRVKRYPSSILKKPSHQHRCANDEFHHSIDVEAEKSYEPCRKHCCMRRPRKVLYNEGIDDLVTESRRYVPLRCTSPVSVRCETSRVSIGSKSCNDGYIPFAHRSESKSKYHTSCMQPTEWDGGRRLGGVRNSQMYVNPQMYRRAATPKRLLSSDQDIDFYIETHTRPVVNCLPRRRVFL